MAGENPTPAKKAAAPRPKVVVYDTTLGDDVAVSDAVDEATARRIAKSRPASHTTSTRKA